MLVLLIRQIEDRWIARIASVVRSCKDPRYISLSLPVPHPLPVSLASLYTSKSTACKTSSATLVDRERIEHLIPRMHAASRAKWFTLITLHCIFPGLTFLHDPSSALLLRPAADSLTHSGVSPRLAAYRVSLLLNGRGEEGTSASCSPRSKVLGRSSASSLCRCQVFSRVTRSVLHRRDPREDVTTMSLRWLCHSREGGVGWCWFRPPRGDDVFEKIFGGEKYYDKFVIVVDGWYISLVTYFSSGQKNVL